MYVCLCNAIRETELEALARQGVRTAEKAYLALGVEVSCACCEEHVQAVLDETAGASLPA